MTGADARRTTAAAVAVVGFVLFVSSGTIVRLYTDLLWFAELGQRAVFVKRLTWLGASGVAFGLAAVVFAWINVYLARRLAPPRTAAVPLVESWYRPFDIWLTQIREALEPAISGAVFLAVAGIGLIEGIAGAASWSLLLRYVNRVPFGQVDPLFGRDVSTYVFELPLWVFLQRWSLGLVVLTGVVTVVVHLVDGAITPRAVGERFAPHVKAHISVLAALLALVVAWGYRLDRWLLLYSPRGQVTGASYTDIHAQLPAYDVLFAVSIAVAVLLFANIRARGWRLPVVGLGAWLVASVVLSGIWPSLVQQLRVAPNELAAEKPYLVRNIEATRRAFGIDPVGAVPFAANTKLSSPALEEDTATISNVRLWDPGTVARTFAQLQEIRLYYDFIDVDVDRYVVDGQRRVVVLSARELDNTKLPSTARTWVNQHLVYTHGYGLVMSPASRVTSDGLPEFLVSNIPPESSDPSLAVSVPAIYYGEVADEDRYVVARSKVEEFDYPQGAANQYTRYSGTGGIRVDSALKRVAFALRFADMQFLVSPAVSSDSRVMFRRNISQRVRTLAPFLTLDPDPYPVLVDGRIKWIQDAYTMTENFPYSQRYEYDGMTFNYIRNSVKIVTDAYDGDVTMYVVDDKDPVLGAWRKAFPSLFTDAARMPDALRAHIRYPEQLFLAQADVLRAYHMKDIGAFYAKEDYWAVPRDVTGAQATDGSVNESPMAPYYVLMRLPGEQRENFILMLPYTPNGKDNMVAWLGATGDATDYGRLSLFAFPKQRLHYGPAQIEAKMNQDPGISSQLTLWNQQGSKVIRGNMLVIPVRESIIYVQPLYLSAAQSQFPQLEKVIVAYGDRLVMENTIADGLLAIFGAPSKTGTSTPPAETTSAAGPPSTVAALIRQATAHFDAAEAAARKGDWATYGRETAALRATLATLASSAGIRR